MMEARAKFHSLQALIVYLLMSSVMGSREVGVSPSHKRSTFLREAVRNLINYTAIEVQAHLDMSDIGSTVAGIAYQKLIAKLTQMYPRHCNDYERLNKPVTSGVTLIKPDDDGEPFRVYCNNDHYGGGWTRIQQRSSSSISFRRDWDTYKEGFGYLSSDGWLGLEKIHRLTKNNTAQLLVMVMDRNYKYCFAQYKRFMVGSEDTEYTLYIGNYSGDAGDSLSFSNYAKFSSYDEDNDGYSYTNCASSYRGGWWYKGSSCASGKLNGDAYSSSSSNYYAKWPTISSYALRLVTMEVKIFD